MAYLANQVLIPHGVNLTLKESFGLTAIVRALKQVLPGYVSSVVRAMYIKKHYKLAYAEYAAGMAYSYVLQATTTGVIAIAFFLFNTSQTENIQITGVVAGIGVILLVLTLPTSRILSVATKVQSRNKYANALLDRTAAAIKSYEVLRNNPYASFKTVGWMLITLCVSGLMMGYAYEALGYTVSFIEAIFITCFSSWATIISLTPSDIGVREGLMSLAASIIGVPVAATLAIALLYRIIMLVVDVSFATIFAPKLFDQSLVDLLSRSRLTAKHGGQ